MAPQIIPHQLALAQTADAAAAESVHCNAVFCCIESAVYWYWIFAYSDRNCKVRILIFNQLIFPALMVSQPIRICEQ